MSTRNLILIFITCILLLIPSMVSGFYRSDAPVHTNFKHTPNLQGDDTPPGLPLSGKQILRSSTTIAEIDGSTGNGKEIVVGGEDGVVYVYHQNGSLMWERRVTECAYSPNNGFINTAPTVANFGGGNAVVIVGYGTIGVSDCSGGVRAYSATGETLWNYSVPVSPISRMSGVLSTPSVADIDGKGDVVVTFGANDLYFYVLNQDGSLRWRYFAMDTIWSSPAFADINNDGRLEIIVGTDFTPGRVCDPANPLQARKETAKGFLYAFDANAHLYFTPDPICARDGGRTIGFGKGSLWSVSFDQSIYSSPAIGDIDKDGQTEIILGASCTYVNAGKWVKIFTANNGNLERTLNSPNCIVSSPAVGDINSDGKLNIVATVSDGRPGNPQTGHGKLIAWSYDNSDPLWIVTPESATGEEADFTEASNNPILADLDGNGSIEVLVAVQNSIAIFRGDNGQSLTTTCTPNGPISACPLKSLFMWMPVRSTPAVSDIDGDGKLELAMGGSHSSRNNASLQNRAFLYVWRDFDTFLNSPAGNQSPYSAPWPMFHGNPQHTGVFVEPVTVTPGIVPSTSEIGALISPDRSRSYALSITNADESPLNWSITENDPNNLVQLSHTSGTSAKPLYITIAVPDSTTSVELGSYTASLTITANGLPDVTVPITVHVVNQIYDVHLPLTVR
jgi:hypothetical protein